MNGNPNDDKALQDSVGSKDGTIMYYLFRTSSHWDAAGNRGRRGAEDLLGRISPLTLENLTHRYNILWVVLLISPSLMKFARK